MRSSSRGAIGAVAVAVCALGAVLVACAFGFLAGAPASQSNALSAGAEGYHAPSEVASSGYGSQGAGPSPAAEVPASAAGGASGDASGDDAGSRLRERIDLGDDPEAYEPGYVLVTIPDGVAPGQVLADLKGNPALEGISLESAGDDSAGEDPSGTASSDRRGSEDDLAGDTRPGSAKTSFLKILLPDTLSVSDAIDLIASSDLVSAVQPNYRYYLQGAHGGAGADPAGGAAADAATTASTPAATTTPSAAAPAPAAPATPATPAAPAAAIQSALAPGSAPETSPGPLEPLGASGSLGTQSSPDDELFADQWYLRSIKAPDAWDALPSATAAEPVTVAVIDSAFRTSHEDLQDNMVTAYDAVRQTESIADSADGGDIDHGTHCAGIVAATAGNGKGIAGVTFNTCKVLPVRVADSEGAIYSSYVASAYSYLVSNRDAYNIRVANMSLGAPVDSEANRATDPVIYDAIQSARDAGIVSVAAACNDDEETPYYAYPADFDNVICVIALSEARSNADGVKLAGYSNYNAPSQMTKNIAAPGSSIVSLFGDGDDSYGYLDGTSMSAPLVAGALGLMFSIEPGLSADEATSKLYSTAKDLSKSRGTAVGWDSATGYGELDVAAAASTDSAYLSGEVKVPVGGTTRLSVKVGGVVQAASGWRWTTSDESIATVSSSGKVTGKKGGQVVVSATKGNRVARQTVLVQVPVSSLDISVDDVEYTGEELTPNPQVLCGDEELERDRDYTLSYSRNLDAGTARVTVEGVEPYYTGSAKAKFKIGKADLNEAAVSLESKTLAYNGKKQRPAVTVKDKGENADTELKRGKDYKLSGGTVSGSGEVTVTATAACKNYKGSVTKRFKVNVSKVPVFRLYNPNSSEHVFTTSASERKALKRAGWTYEGIAWKEPASAGGKVFRLYNRRLGDHLYTKSAKERNRLVKSHGWKDEGCCWRTFAPSGKPVFRLYNPNLASGQHHYTKSARERDVLTSQYGWVYEGVGWYAA